MKKVCIYILLAAAFCGCRKEDRADHNRTLYIRGRAFLTDTITQNIVNLPLKDTKILLSDNISDTDNYMYSVRTDTDGYFVFDLLKSRKKDIDKYRVSYRDSIRSVYYSGETIVPYDDNDIVLNIGVDVKRQNVMLVSATDNMGGVIPGATVLLFTSQVLANIGDTAGAIGVLRTDTRGRVFKFGLPQGVYYLTASKKAGSTELKRGVKKVVIAADSGVITDSLQLN